MPLAARCRRSLRRDPTRRSPQPRRDPPQAAARRCGRRRCTGGCRRCRPASSRHKAARRARTAVLAVRDPPSRLLQFLRRSVFPATRPPAHVLRGDRRQLDNRCSLLARVLRPALHARTPRAPRSLPGTPAGLRANQSARGRASRWLLVHWHRQAVHAFGQGRHAAVSTVPATRRARPAPPQQIPLPSLSSRHWAPSLGCRCSEQLAGIGSEVERLGQPGLVDDRFVAGEIAQGERDAANAVHPPAAEQTPLQALA